MLTAKATYVKGMQFVGDAESGHAIVMDADPYFGCLHHFMQHSG
jgi:hypothetical protein